MSSVTAKSSMKLKLQSLPGQPGTSSANDDKHANKYANISSAESYYAGIRRDLDAGSSTSPTISTSISTN